jgi:hypothetical protein
VPNGIKLQCKINFTAYVFVKELAIKFQQLRYEVRKGNQGSAPGVIIKEDIYPNPSPDFDI